VYRATGPLPEIAGVDTQLKHGDIFAFDRTNQGVSNPTSDQKKPHKVGLFRNHEQPQTICAALNFCYSVRRTKLNKTGTKGLRTVGDLDSVKARAHRCAG
jgi:hypothetical protein